MTCRDKYAACPSWTLNCNSFADFNDCPYTCGRCAPLYCVNSNVGLCQNGGTCQNITNLVDTNNRTQFGFRCQCAPGFTGELCETSKYSASSHKPP